VKNVDLEHRIAQIAPRHRAKCLAEMFRRLRVTHQKMKSHSELRARPSDQFCVAAGLIDVERFLQHCRGFRPETRLPVSTAERAEDAGAVQPCLLQIEERRQYLYRLRGLAFRGELVRACYCHGSFTSLFFKLTVFHEEGSRLPKLCRHVLEGFHRGTDLSELDRAHMGARVIGGTQLRLAQACCDACLTESLTQLAQCWRVGGRATLASARGHGARRYARVRAASTVNRQCVLVPRLEPDDGRIRGIFEVVRVNEAKLSQPTVHQHRVRPCAAGKETDPLQHVAVSHARRDKSHVLPARQVVGTVDAAVVHDPHLLRACALLIVTELETPEDLCAKALERSGGDLGRALDGTRGQRPR